MQTIMQKMMQKNKYKIERLYEIAEEANAMLVGSPFMHLLEKFVEAIDEDEETAQYLRQIECVNMFAETLARATGASISRILGILQEEFDKIVQNNSAKIVQK